MLLQRATVRNVSRALREIKALEWEGDYQPMARQALKEIMEKRLEQEMAEFIGLQPYERDCDRSDYRNGRFLRHRLTEMGDLELLVPRTRKGGFQPRLLKRYARRKRSIDKVMLACFCLGLSTRDALVYDLTR